MSRIVRHSNYTEITNGLFMEIADKEFTFAEQDGFLKRIQDVVVQPITRLTRQDIEEAVNHVFAQDRPTHERDVVLYTSNPFIGDEYSRALQEGVQREVERARIENERLSLQLRNMSEQQLLEHFDRISQEEEN